jgi:hypothetical protein
MVKTEDHKSPIGMSGGCRLSHAVRFLQVPFFFRLEMIHCPLLRNVSGARQTEHWRLRGGFGGLAILASVGLGLVPGWQCWHSGRAGSSGDRIRVGIRHEAQNWVSGIVVREVTAIALAQSRGVAAIAVRKAVHVVPRRSCSLALRTPLPQVTHRRAPQPRAA